MNRSALLIFILVLASCSVSHIDRYPGKPLNGFPVSLQGEYKMHPGGLRTFFAGKQLDSARVRILLDRVQTLNQDGWNDEFVIGPDKVLSQLDQYYFLSSRDAAEPDYWNISMVWGSENDLYLTMINATDKNLQKDKLRNYLNLHLVIRDHGKSTDRVISTSDKALLKTLSAINSDSHDSVLYYQMNDSTLMNFIRKESGTNNALHFMRVKSEWKNK
jgi:hypothetical protein